MACGRELKSDVRTMGSNSGMHLQVFSCGNGDGYGIHSGAGSGVDVKRNTGGEGGVLNMN